eukprot:4260427-Alexandrium_andersonii.AAC.1
MQNEVEHAWCKAHVELAKRTQHAQGEQRHPKIPAMRMASSSNQAAQATTPAIYHGLLMLDRQTCQRVPGQHGPHQQ